MACSTMHFQFSCSKGNGYKRHQYLDCFGQLFSEELEGGVPRGNKLEEKGETSSGLPDVRENIFLELDFAGNKNTDGKTSEIKLTRCIQWSTSYSLLNCMASLPEKQAFFPDLLWASPFLIFAFGPLKEAHPPLFWPLLRPPVMYK